MPSSSRSSVAQFSLSASQLIKLIKSVSSLVLRKEKVTIVCVFYEMRRLKKESHCYSLRFLRKTPTKKLEEEEERERRGTENVKTSENSLIPTEITIARFNPLLQFVT